jgi:hypothetical protein
MLLCNTITVQITFHLLHFISHIIIVRLQWLRRNKMNEVNQHGPKVAGQEAASARGFRPRGRLKRGGLVARRQKICPNLVN